MPVYKEACLIDESLPFFIEMQQTKVAENFIQNLHKKK